jgi:hypothetical protein
LLALATALKENPEEKVKRLLEEAAAGKAPAEKYTVRLMGTDAARLEGRAQARGVTASGYVAPCCVRTCEPIRRCPMESFRS